MKTLLTIPAALLMASCSSTDLQATLDRLEFDAEEYGTFEMEGTVDIDPSVFFRTNVHLKLEKHKDKPGIPVGNDLTPL